MLKYEIKLPSIEEQIKIGEYFDSLDYLITLNGEERWVRNVVIRGEIED